MKARVIISEARGTIEAPASKSAVQRYIAGSLLANGTSVIKVSSLCDDSLAAISLAEGLGAEVKKGAGSITIQGGFKPASREISCGESGLSARMFTPIIALHNSEIVLNGKGSIMKRPLDMVERPLAALGAKVLSANGYLPLRITGPLQGGDVDADGSVSSQFITGLLTALPVVAKNSRINVTNLVSKPYIDLTISILEEFGVEILNNNYSIFRIKGRQKFMPGTFRAEGDWSGSAFLLVMGAIEGAVEVTGLLKDSTQADKALIEAFSRAGARVTVKKNSVNVEGGDLKGFEFDISECPDLAPPLVVLALACKGKTVLKGTSRLAAKESDRGKALEECMRAIGGNVTNYGSKIAIHGGEKLKGGRASSYNDHRIAMALAASSSLAEFPVTIEGIECINKSYPGFTDDFISLGGTVEFIK